MTPTKEQYEKATRLLRTASGGTLEPQDLEWQNARAKADKEFAELIAQFAADEAEAARADTLLEAECAVLSPWDDLGDRPSSPPAAIFGACDRIRALAPTQHALRARKSHDE